MTIPSFDTAGMDDDFRPEDFSAASPVPIRDDFVARTLDRIRADRERIAADSARLEDPTALDAAIPATTLAAYRVPEPSVDFVATTLTRALAEREAKRHRSLDDRALQDLIEQYVPPRISADFVDRTLTALSATASAAAPARLRALERTSRPRPSGTWRRWAAAAAVALLGVSAWLWRSEPTPAAPGKRGPDLATSSAGPAAVHARVARELGAPHASRPDLDLDLVPLDGLLVLAEGLGSRGE